jgi:hypothetical protein
MLTFRRALLALAIVALFLGFAFNADGQQNFRMTVPEAQLHQLFKTNYQRPLPVEYKNKKIGLEWKEYSLPDGLRTHTFRIFFRPDTGEEWFFYYSLDERSVEVKDGKHEIRHKAKLWVAERPFPSFLREPKLKLIANYDGFSIDESIDMFCEILEKILELSIPAGFEM